MGAIKADPINQLFDPARLDDLHATIQLLSENNRFVCGIGFSMGACMLVNYVARYADFIPKEYQASLSWSGAFKLDFVTQSRYEEVFQPVLLDSIIEDIEHRYEDEIERILTKEEISNLKASKTYKEFHNNMLKLRTDGLTETHLSISLYEFEAWRGRSCPSISQLRRIETPLLVVSSLDDPLHHPEHIGMDLFEAAQASNVAVWLTGTGGHVAWPEAQGPGPFSFMSRVSLQYLAAAEAAPPRS